MTDATSPPVAVGAPSKQPKGLYLLFGVEMWERFSYYGMRALLVLFLVSKADGFGWTKEEASHVFGWYTSLVYLTPLLGGYLADRFIGTHRCLITGGIVIAAGHVCLAFVNQTSFFVGLGLIIVGTGFFKSNVSTMVGQMYTEGDRRRDAGFTIFYMGINTGAFFGQIVCGAFQESPRFGFHWAFGAAAVGMLLGLAMYVSHKRRYLGEIGDRPAREVAASVADGPSAPLTHDERQKILAIFVMAFFDIFFWLAFEQAGSSMNFFAAERTQRTFAGFQVPTAWFQSINPLAIMLFAPVFARLWTWLAARGREPNTPVKFGIALLTLSAGFVFMVVGARASEGGVLVSPLWLTAAYVVHTLAELCLSPVGLSMITKLSPPRYGSVLMGTWFLATATANFIGGRIAGTVEKIERGEVFHLFGGQADFFFIFVVSSAAAGVAVLLLSGRINKLMHGSA